METKPVKLKRTSPTLHLLLFIVIAAISAAGYLAIIWAGRLRGYDASLLIAARNLGFLLPVLAIFFWLTRKQRFRGEMLILTSAIFLFAVGMLMQFRLFSDPEYGAGSIYILSKQTLDNLHARAVPDSVTNKLKGLENKEYEDPLAFENSLKKVLGEEDAAKFTRSIVRAARVSEKPRERRVKDQAVRLLNIQTAYDDQKKAFMFGSANAVPKEPPKQGNDSGVSVGGMLTSANTYIPIAALLALVAAFLIFKEDKNLLWFQKHSLIIGLATLVPFAILVLLFSAEGKFLGQTTPWEAVKILFLFS